MTPSQPAALHLKSGAAGFFFEVRLSHMGPPHFGHAGMLAEAASAGAAAGWPLPLAGA